MTRYHSVGVEILISISFKHFRNLSIPYTQQIKITCVKPHTNVVDANALSNIVTISPVIGVQKGKLKTKEQVQNEITTHAWWNLSFWKKEVILIDEDFLKLEQVLGKSWAKSLIKGF